MTNQLRDGHGGHLEDALQLAPIGAFLADMEGNCFFVNNEWENISGLTRKESVGNGWLKIIIKEDAPEVAATIQNAVSLPLKPVSLSFRIMHPKNGLRFLKVRARQVTETAAAPYFLGYVEDVTAEKEAESRHLE